MRAVRGSRAAAFPGAARMSGLLRYILASLCLLVALASGFLIWSFIANYETEDVTSLNVGLLVGIALVLAGSLWLSYRLYDD